MQYTDNMKTAQYPASICSWCDAPLNNCIQTECNDCKEDFDLERQRMYEFEERKQLNNK